MVLFETLGRMLDQPDTTLKVRCDCGQQREWTRREALQRFPPGCTPQDVRRRLRCTLCRRKGEARVWI
jgi:hypothetical protein